MSWLSDVEVISVQENHYGTTTLMTVKFKSVVKNIRCRILGVNEVHLSKSLVMRMNNMNR